jgi:hypothetical protein
MQSKKKDSTPITPTSQELSALAQSLYATSSKTLQNYLTNCIISKRNIDFYLKRTFDVDPTLKSYNFYKETDPIRLKILLEIMMKNVHTEAATKYQAAKSTEDTNISEELKTKLNSLLSKVTITTNSIQSTKKAEYKLFKYILDELLPHINSDEIKENIQYIIEENANIEHMIDSLNKEADQFSHELSKDTFIDFALTTESPQKSPEKGNRDIFIDDDNISPFSIDKTVKKPSRILDDSRPSSKSNLENTTTKQELEAYQYLYLSFYNLY